MLLTVYISLAFPLKESLLTCSSHDAFTSFDIQSALKENIGIVKVRNLKIMLGFTKLTVIILSDKVAIHLISHISQILVKNVGMGNQLSWPLLKIFLLIKGQ